MPGSKPEEDSKYEDEFKEEEWFFRLMGKSSPLDILM